MERFNEDNSMTIPIHFRAIPWNQTSGSIAQNHKKFQLKRTLLAKEKSQAQRSFHHSKMETQYSENMEICSLLIFNET